MAADRPLLERGIVEIKMGRSKFPGKPSKIGNRKRVNLSSCALLEDNDSSKAAKNIYLGLSVFNETFGDNEMVAPGPFHGFSKVEVQKAMAEARLQQNEAETELKKHGINISLWETFQKELFSINTCSNYKNVKNNNEINKATLSFDGGGYCTENDTSIKSITSEDNQISKSALRVGLQKNYFNNQRKEIKAVRFQSCQLRLSKLKYTSLSNKSLQSQAARKLLERAKMSNVTEGIKINKFDKKFVLPCRSIHSSRLIKPSKKFLEDSINNKLIKGKSVHCASERKKVKENCHENSMKKEVGVCFQLDIGNKECNKKAVKDELSTDGQITKFSTEVDQNRKELQNKGKVILREPRLQLVNGSLSLLEGPFSSSASSLNSDCQPRVSSIQSVTHLGNIICGVCGIVRFYKFVNLAKKFGIFCCEFCRKFISKVIKSSNVEKNLKFHCVKGKGLCELLPITRDQQFDVGKRAKSLRCHACWLKTCLKNFKMPNRLKHKLLKLLPVKMQMSINLDLSPLIPNGISNKFMMLKNTNIKDFKWLDQNIYNPSEERLTSTRLKQLNWSNTESFSTNFSGKCLRKRKRTSESDNKVKLLTQNTKAKVECDEMNRQVIALKGPRVKHVCRSASVALGQPLATFLSESSPTKKPANESAYECNDCDNSLKKNNLFESQEVLEKSNKEVISSNIKQDRKLKQVSILKTPKNLQQSGVNKPKKKLNVKVENPVCMDFWESYDPDEVSEIGFGLIGSEPFSVRALCFLCGSSGQERLIHCASCCEPYHEFCIDEGQLKLKDSSWQYDWVCPRCTVCITCGRTSGQQLKCVKCDNSYHTECVDRLGGRLLHSPDRPWVCSVCLRCKSCNGIDVSVFVGNLPLCKACFELRQKGNYCPLCQRCYEDDDYDSKMMECGQCKCWVHAKCEGLSDEKYQVLSFLPESVEYVCRMCCVMPPAPWWIAVEGELKSGYLGVLKALSKNRRACAMLKWSPRKQCTCKQINFVSRALDFEETKSLKLMNNLVKNSNSSVNNKEVVKSVDQASFSETNKGDKYKTASITERKTSIEVINHPTETLKLTLKILKGAEANELEKLETSVFEESEKEKNANDGIKCKDKVLRVKKCPSNEENSEDSLTNIFDCQEDSQTSLQSLFKKNDFGTTAVDSTEKRSLSSPLNPPSDSGIGSTDDELKPSCLTDEESCRLDEQQLKSNKVTEGKSDCDTSVSFIEEKHECFCFLDVDSYNSRSKPFSPNLMSIKKKVTTSEYSSLHQFHQDMQRMIATTQSEELMDLYHQTIKEIFPWFDPKFSRVQSNSQKLAGTVSVDSTPVKNSPIKSSQAEECRVPKEKLSNQPIEFFYGNYVVEDNRICLMCKSLGDGPPRETGRLLYCGQNEWVHCNCALWSGEVFEEIDGSLQNVHSAISRGRSIRCPACHLKGASIGCCARNCQDTYHFICARKVGCAFMDDKTVYCPAHVKEAVGKIIQNEKEFEIRRPVYVELDKRKMKSADSSQIKFAVGSLHVNKLGRFVFKLSDQPEAIIPEQFECTRLFWSCYEPWKIVRYYFSVRLVQIEDEGIDYGVNITIDHSREPEHIELKLKQLKYFQENKTFLDINENEKEHLKEIGNLSNFSLDHISKTKSEEPLKLNSIKRIKKDQKVVKKIFDHFDSREDETCLSDNQNTTGLLPPDLEEAIFKDLPHDILDGISVQDIFMDIKSDSYESSTKDGIAEYSEGDYISESSSKLKKNESNSEVASQNEIWNEVTDDSHQISKSSRELKKYKADVLSNHQLRKSANLKTYQKSGFNWNCKLEGSNNKLKKGSKCHLTVNLLEAQDRGETLQELKFPDGLVSVSTGTLDSVKDLKTRLEDNKHSIQQEEGKENKCLQWHSRLQPRLLQVDGSIDSSSSGSEAGESPKRVLDDNIVSKTESLPDSSCNFDSSRIYFSNSPVYRPLNSSEVTKEIFSKNYGNFSHPSNMGSLSQLDGVSDRYYELSNSEESELVDILHKRSKKDKEHGQKNAWAWESLNFKINQCDGGVDSESEDGEPLKLSEPNDFSIPILTSSTKEEPVKCNQCLCTYRTKMSYQRHLEACCNVFMLSSSEGETSDDESSKKKSNNNHNNFKLNEMPSLKEENKTERIEESAKEKNDVSCSVIKQNLSPEIQQYSANEEKVEARKDKSFKRTYTKKKPAHLPSKTSVVTSFHEVQQNSILVQQPEATPTIIVQDMPTPNLVPATFLDSGAAIGYVTAVDTQNFFGKTQVPQIIATPNGFVSGNFQFPSVSESQIFGGVCLNPSNIHTSVPGFLIQQPHPSGTLFSTQPGHIMMSSDGQMVIGPTGLYDIVRDGSGGMFLASRNQPVFYNTETIVSNTFMQTNQFVSNVLATSFSQTSTQIFQARELEQLVNLPSNYIFVGHSPSGASKILSTDDLICVQPPQTLISSPIQINQTIFNPSLQTVPTEAKIIPTQLNSIRYFQPVANNALPAKPNCPSLVLNKIVNPNTQITNHPVSQIYQASEIPRSASQNGETKIRILNTNKISDSTPKTVPAIRPNSTKTQSDDFEKSVVASKVKLEQVQPRTRALVDYINNFKSDNVDVVAEKGNLKRNRCSESEKFLANTISRTSESYSQFKSNDSALNFGKRLESSSSSNISVSGSHGSDVKTGQLPREKGIFEIPDVVTPSLKTVSPDVSSSEHCNFSVRPNESDQSFEIFSSQKKEESLAENNDNFKPLHNSHLPDTLSNMTNSFLFDKEQKLSLNILNLKKNSLTTETHFSKTSSVASLSNDKQTSETFPLQETSKIINTVCKSPKTISPVKQVSSPTEDNEENKKKGSFHNQNIGLTTSTFKFFQTNKDENLKSLPKKIQNENFIKKYEEKGPKLVFDVTSDDGYKNSSTSMSELWAKICDSVQEMRAVLKIPPLPMPKKGHEILGMKNHGLQYCLEQLRGVEQCIKYKCKYFTKKESQKEDEDDLPYSKENLSGCARAEQFITRKEYDMFGWLASKHRRLPKLIESAEETLSSIRRANSLPMAMKYRNLKETAKFYVGVYRSKIHGKGLFCLREIEAGEMVIEYAGEVIRSTLTDKREKYYTDKGIGCYMFRIDDHFVIDATMKGNAARFINHSCEPNCYSRVVDILGKKHIVIFALRRINIMEELTYDYKFPFEDEKISCHCLSKKCRKYLN